MRKFVSVIIVLATIIPIGRFLIGNGYFKVHDDLHLMRLNQIEKCLKDGQIPCRYSSDMSYGYGQPMFNFYAPFPYYLGALIRIIFPLSIIATVNTLFLISLVLSGIGMYLLAARLWGTLGGILSAVLYIYAPYHALDIFVRGALGESYALMILPFIFLGCYILIKKPSINKITGLSCCLFILFTSHNISTLIYTPFIILWSVFWVYKYKSLHSLKAMVGVFLIGAGLASFFLLPAAVEQSLIQTQYLRQDYYEFRAHFVSIAQLFWERNWGYGPSVYGPKDDISFQIGWPHWWLVFPLIVITVFWLAKFKHKLETSLITLFLTLSLFITFLIHAKSVFIWENLAILGFVQFPWRFLGLTIFFLSLAGGALNKIKFRYFKAIVITLIALTIFLNYQYFKPLNYTPNMSDDQKLKGKEFEIAQGSAVLDYLPVTVKVAPRQKAPDEPEVVSGRGSMTNFSKRSNSFGFDAEIYEKSIIEIPIIYFPSWVVILDGSRIAYEPKGALGLINIEIPAGKHVITGRFENTPIRTLGNITSVISFLLLFCLVVISESKKYDK